MDNVYISQSKLSKDVWMDVYICLGVNINKIKISWCTFWTKSLTLTVGADLATQNFDSTSKKKLL